MNTRSHYKQQARNLVDNLTASIIILNYGYSQPQLVWQILSSFLLIYIVTLPQLTHFVLFC